MWSANFGRKPKMYLTRLRKLLTLVANQGLGHLMILSHLDDCGSIPWAEIWSLRKYNSVMENWHFLVFRYKHECWRACMIRSMYFWCLSRLSHLMTTSYMYTWQNQLMYSWRAAIIHHWWIDGAFFRPIAITIHSYWPKGVVTMVNRMSSGWTRVWKKELVMSNLYQIFPLPQSVRISSTWGKGCGSRMVSKLRMW